MLELLQSLPVSLLFGGSVADVIGVLSFALLLLSDGPISGGGLTGGTFLGDAVSSAFGGVESNGGDVEV